MHEWALCTALVSQVEEEARRHGAIRVTAVRVVAGALTGIVPELLVRAYEVARTGTLLESAPLSVEIEPVSGHCPSCGQSDAVDHLALVCTGCGGPLKLEGGAGVVLRELELELPDEVGEEANGV